MLFPLILLFLYKKLFSMFGVDFYELLFEIS
ncbi:hypothetical protein BHO_0036300 [Borrelia hermsii YBT]|nr:hypothetical protein BHO_0036300 [Borrelia hermsii YBT]